MSFDRPLLLVALAAVPLLAALWAVQERRRRDEAARFATPGLVPNLVGDRPGRRRLLPLALFLVGIAALTMGAARPRATVTVPRKEATILLAVDVSRSMRAEDVRPTRLAAAKRAAAAFIDEVPPLYKIGVIGIGSRAFVAVPPTVDRALAQNAVAGLTPSEGTALGDAIALGSRIAKRQKAGDGAVAPSTMLMISDGLRDGGRAAPAPAARRAKLSGLPVSTVLVGTPNGIVENRLAGGYVERIRVPSQGGQLRDIARLSGGRFYSARSASALKKVYEQLATRVGRTTKDRQISDVFAAGGLLLMLGGAGLSALWFRRIA